MLFIFLLFLGYLVYLEFVNDWLFIGIGRVGRLVVGNSKVLLIVFIIRGIEGFFCGFFFEFFEV